MLYTDHSIKSLTVGVNNIDHFIIIQCSAGKPWVLYPSGCYLDTYYPPKH